MERTVDELRLDGNAAAGLLGEMLSFDVTRATVVCDGCGRSSRVGELLLYGQEMGVVLRCPGCDSVLMCATKIHGEIWLDLRGTRSLRVAVDPPALMDEAGLGEAAELHAKHRLAETRRHHSPG